MKRHSVDSQGGMAYNSVFLSGVAPANQRSGFILAVYHTLADAPRCIDPLAPSGLDSHGSVREPSFLSI